jgi:DNA-binding transcriptional ArsR family regulator
MDELNQLFEKVSGYFLLLSEPTRLKILHALCDGEKSVTDVVASVDSTQANVSRHLNTMYRAGVLGRRKEGNMVYYVISDETCVELCRSVCTQIACSMEEQNISKRAVRDFMPLG